MKKPFVRSWDAFDTLIARKCIQPERIFESISASDGPAFVAARVNAEEVAGRQEDSEAFGDIYNHIQAFLDWDDSRKLAALDAEIQAEMDNVIPIAENMSRVRDGDLVVSDMYLPPKIVLAMLRSAGLTKTVDVIVSRDGKSNGSMWKRLRRRFNILLHTGDNPRSDFLQPLRHGIPARLTEASAETEWERTLRCNGAPELGSFVREMRLRTHHEDPASRALQRAQVEANFPLLLIAGAALVRWCETQGISRALMSSRDCVLWAPLAAKLAQHAGSTLAVEYFLTSRVAALKSSDHFLAYARKRISTSSVVVDLSMTGISLAGLADRLGLPEVNAYVISWHQSATKTLYGRQYVPSAKVLMNYLTSEVIKEDLESVNQASTPSVHDVEETPKGLEVTYGHESRPKEVLEAIAIQDATFNQMLDHVPASVLDEAFTLADSTKLVFLVRECARQIDRFDTVIGRARPGSALRNDPNALKLGLPYATQHAAVRAAENAMRWAASFLPRRGPHTRALASGIIAVFRRA